MKLTEEEYTDLVQKRLEYKLTFDDYCRLENDKWINTYFEFLSIEMVNTPEKRVENQRKRKDREFESLNSTITEIRDFIEQVDLYPPDSFPTVELESLRHRINLGNVIKKDTTLEDVKNILKCLEKHLEESLPRLKGHSAMSGKHKERNYWLKEISERMNVLSFNKERVKDFLFIILYENNFDGIKTRYDSDDTADAVIDVEYREIFKQVIKEVRKTV